METDWLEVLGWSQEQLEELRFSGFFFLREGHYQQALLFFEALVILDPHSAYDAQTLGALYLEMGNTEKALQALDRALDFDRSHEPTLLNKAKAFIMADRKAEALVLAEQLSHSKDQTIAGDATALLFAYNPFPRKSGV